MQNIHVNISAYSVVTCLKVGENHLYIGGNFSGVGNTNQQCLAKVSLNGNGELDINWRPQINHWVSALELVEENLYVGGLFTNVSNTNINYVAKIKANGQVDTSWNLNPNYFVTDLYALGSDIFISGAFSSIGGKNIHNLAQVNILGEVNTDWHQIPIQGSTNSMCSIGNELFVTGNFWANTSQKYLTKLSKTTGIGDNSWGGRLDEPGYAIALNSNEVYVGGSFRNIDGNSISGFAIYPLTLASPKNLTVVPQEPIKMNLSWTDGAGEANYVILRSTTSGSGYTEIATVNANVTTYQDALPQTPTLLTYYYVVRAKNGSLVSANSNEAFATATSIERWKGSEVSISPNPTTDIVKVTFTSLSSPETNLQITNEQGKIMWQTAQHLNEKEIEISIKNYPVGIYYLTFRQGKEILTKKIVKL